MPPLAGRATLICQRAAGPLRLLWPAAQLSGTQRLPPTHPVTLALLPAAAQPEKPADGVGPVRGSDGAPSMLRVTFGKSRVREIRTLGSVRAKAEWLSYPTMTLFIGFRRSYGAYQSALPPSFLRLRFARRSALRSGGGFEGPW